MYLSLAWKISETVKAIASTLFMTLMLNGQSEAIFIIYKKNIDQIIEYDQLPLNDQKEYLDIYNNILLRYDWPTVQMYYPEFEKEEQKEYIEVLGKTGDDLKDFLQKKVDKKYDDKYIVEFLPNTAFDLLIIMTQIKYLIKNKNNLKGLDPSDIRNDSSDDIITDAIDSFKKHAFLSKDNYKQIFKQPNEKKGLMNLFHDGINEYKTICKDEEKIEKGERFLVKIFNAFEKMQETYGSQRIPSTSEKKVEDFLYFFGLNYENFKKKDPHKLRLQEEVSKKILHKALILEMQAYKKNHFVLFRGTEGHCINKNNPIASKIIDSVKGISSDDCYYASYYSPIFKQFTSEQRGLSFANSILAGTFNEGRAFRYLIGTNPKNARTWDFMITLGIAYGLDFSMKSFLIDTLESDDSVSPLSARYYIPPVSPTLALFGQKEHFHSRTRKKYDDGYRANFFDAFLNYHTRSLTRKFKNTDMCLSLDLTTEYLKLIKDIIENHDDEIEENADSVVDFFLTCLFYIYQSIAHQNILDESKKQNLSKSLEDFFNLWGEKKERLMSKTEKWKQNLEDIAEYQAIIKAAIGSKQKKCPLHPTDLKTISFLGKDYFSTFKDHFLDDTERDLDEASTILIDPKNFFNAYFPNKDFNHDNKYLSAEDLKKNQHTFYALDEKQRQTEEEFRKKHQEQFAQVLKDLKKN